MFEIEQAAAQGAKIKVVGVGGSGCNAVNTMIRMGLQGVEFITANTDKQALDISLAQVKLPIGQELTKGLGAGANPDVGRKAALEDYARISEILAGADMVFITAGMGGGTGTGAAPVFAKIAKEIGALTVGVATKPFMFEGRKRMKNAELGLASLRDNVDSLITIPNQKLLAISGTTLSMIDAFKRADEVLLNAVQGISDLINHTGLINSDFADVRTIMQNKGLALMGIGYASGEHRSVEAATNAISSPLLEDVSIDGATGIIINITGGSSMTIHEVNEATTLIMEAAHEDAEIIFGTVIDDSLKDQIKVTVIATGLGGRDQQVVVAKPAETTISTTEPLTLNAAAPAPVQMELKPAEPAPVQPEPILAAVEAVKPLPPQPNPQMLAAAAAYMKGQGTEDLFTAAQRQAEEDAVEAFDEEDTEMHSDELTDSQDQELDETSEDRPNIVQMGAGAEGGELARARAIAQRLGITNLTDDEYDIPTYLRRQQEKDLQ